MRTSGRIAARGAGAIEQFLKEEVTRREGEDIVRGVLVSVRLRIRGLGGEPVFLSFADHIHIRIRENCRDGFGRIRAGSITETRMNRMRRRIVREAGLDEH